MAEHTEDVQHKIAELRVQIDEVDCRIVKLINQRAELALAIRELKPKVNLGLYDPKREEEIFTRLSACNGGPLYDDNLREIYEAILHVMKEL
ncbi:MAG: chorismate mutase [Coriobacteriia bacterium]|nr:chorismate mutase [Coriobacteriia bacterium]